VHHFGEALRKLDEVSWFKGEGTNAIAVKRERGVKLTPDHITPSLQSQADMMLSKEMSSNSTEIIFCLRVGRMVIYVHAKAALHLARYAL
jgi:hypothetical protein